MKRCSECKIEKPITEFYSDISKKDKHHTRCKACESIRQKNRHIKAPERYVAYLMGKIVGISTKDAIQIVRETLSVLKKECGICGNINNLNIDHCHKTGFVRGWLCGFCNRGIGLFHEDIKIMEKAIDYIRLHSTTMHYIVSHCNTNEDK